MAGGSASASAADARAGIYLALGRVWNGAERTETSLRPAPERKRKTEELDKDSAAGQEKRRQEGSVELDTSLTLPTIFISASRFESFSLLMLPELSVS